MANKEDKILVCVKMPGEEPYVDHVPNTLEAFQRLVGGYIESFRIAEDVTLLCNEEGLLRGMPYNATIRGNPFVGPVVAVGVKGEDFCSLPAAQVPFLLKVLRGRKYG